MGHRRLCHTVIGMRFILVLLILLLVLVVTFIAVLLFVLTPADRRMLFSRSESIVVDGAKRNYKLVNANGADARPLIIGLHGYRDRPEWLAAYSGLHLLAEQEDAILALPQGKQQSWNGSFCCGWAWQNNVADTEFILEMITAIEREQQIDTSRIYLVGFSNGGILAQKLLHEQPQVFAASASVMSGVGDSENILDISNAQAPLLLINGTKDNYVPLAHPLQTNDFSFLPAFDTSSTWAEHYGLGERQSSQKGDYTEYTWADDTDQKLVQRIYPTSHRWPEWRLWSMPGDVPNSTQDMWEFLQSKRLDE